MVIAKKSFGQHFLRDQSVVDKIIAATDPAAFATVVEVGPGTGALTEYVAPLARRLVLLEADRDLVPSLKERYPNAEIVQGDAAKADFSAIAGNRDWVLVANLPYNAANAIIMQALTSPFPPQRLVVMVQKEVGERMLAKPGDMSLLSVAVQLYADVTRVCTVKPGAFNPPPKVDSMVVALTPKGDANHESTIRLAKIGFANRRKQLHRNLVDARELSSEKTKEFLKLHGLSELARAEDLTVEHWIALAAHIDEYKKRS